MIIGPQRGSILSLRVLELRPSNLHTRIVEGKGSIFRLRNGGSGRESSEGLKTIVGRSKVNRAFAAFLVDGELADQVWDAWDAGEIDDSAAFMVWALIAGLR